MIRSHDPAEEHWYIQRARCGCGGKFEPQGLMQHWTGMEDGKDTSVFETACALCGAPRRFVFDASYFFDCFSWSIDEIREATAHITDQGRRKRMMVAALSPGAAAAGMIGILVEQDDDIALDWLHDLILRARGTVYERRSVRPSSTPTGGVP